MGASRREERRPRTVFQRIRIPEPPQGARTLLINFNVTRGLLAPRPIAGWENLRLDEEWEELPRNILAIPIRDLSGLWADEPKRILEVLSIGERLELLRLVYAMQTQGSAEEFAVVDLPVESGCVDTEMAFARLTVAGSAEEQLVKPPIYIAELEQLLAIEPTLKVQAYREFFATLDQLTLPSLIAVTNKTTDGEKLWTPIHIEAAGNHLETRLQSMAVDYDKGGQNTPPETTKYFSSDGQKQPIQYLSDLQIGLAKDRFKTAGGDFDLDAFEEAFEMFANGELRLELPQGVWTTQPSSGYFFYFAEFAFLAMLELDQASKDSWGKVLNVLVRTQRIYARVYAGKTIADAVPESYGGCDYDPTRVYTWSEREALRADFAGLSTHDLRLAMGAQTVKTFPGLLT